MRNNALASLKEYAIDLELLEILEKRSTRVDVWLRYLEGDGDGDLFFSSIKDIGRLLSYV
jgi:hypothetical protein